MLVGVFAVTNASADVSVDPAGILTVVLRYAYIGSLLEEFSGAQIGTPENVSRLVKNVWFLDQLLSTT
jgi:hypothetical protein